MSDRRQQLDWQAIRERLSQAEGKAVWQSLEELADSDHFRQTLAQEFAQGVEVWENPISRRRFLKLAAASLGLAGLTACAGQPAERILPYVDEPEEVVPGTPLFFATAHLLGGYAQGLLAESHMGRPTKVEGNPRHPASLGATDAYAQASVLTLYDPDRSTEPLREGEPARWQQFEATLQDALSQADVGLRILTPTITSPSLLEQLRQIGEAFPQAMWHQYEPVNWDNAYGGTELAFGRPLQAVYDLNAADVILSLDADFLGAFPGRLRYTRDFSQRREVAPESLQAGPEEAQMNRLYALSSTSTLTSSMADHHWTLRPAQIAGLARLLAQRLGIDVAAPETLPEQALAALEPLVAELSQNRGQSVIVPGMAQPAEVHALAHAMNAALGNIGETVIYTEPVPGSAASQLDSLQTLVGDMENGDVDVLIVIDGNPAYTAPADVPFAQALQNVPLSAHLSFSLDETSTLCDWHLPLTHYLETWSDARAYDGTATIMQPLIQPLYQNRSAHEVLAMVLGGDARTSHEIVRQFWQNQVQAEAFEEFWHGALHSGVVPETAFAPVEVALRSDFTLPERPESDDEAEIVVVFRPDPSVWDGRFAQNAWLQELPKPFSKLTWDNAALIGPALAERLDLQTEDVIRLAVGARQVEAAVFVLPGQAPGCITVHLGYGRRLLYDEGAGAGAGFNAYTIRYAGALWFAASTGIEKVSDTYELATTQPHQTMAGRDLVRVATLQAFREDPHLGQAAEEDLPSLYPEYAYDDHAWAMSINLNTCTGCNACVVACQAENNIPVVGKEGVREGRHMHWLRIDDYFAGEDLDAPRVYHQPVPCMHCEKAPCEPVCPVAATTHSAEGLNEMTYDRCIGTRYCSNNCPYKVRRFNFFDYARDNKLVNLAYNPDVTVRWRGVMEKCTYCVQRINRARSTARSEGRSIGENEVQTACAQACPANAIVFGDANNPESDVARRKALPHDYALLAELGTQPRTTYLTKLLNINDEIEE